jgi:hypothetical protein
MAAALSLGFRTPLVKFRKPRTPDRLRDTNIEKVRKFESNPITSVI